MFIIIRTTDAICNNYNENKCAKRNISAKLYGRIVWTDAGRRPGTLSFQHSADCLNRKGIAVLQYRILLTNPTLAGTPFTLTLKKGSGEETFVQKFLPPGVFIYTALPYRIFRDCNSVKVGRVCARVREHDLILTCGKLDINLCHIRHRPASAVESGHRVAHPVHRHDD